MTFQSPNLESYTNDTTYFARWNSNLTKIQNSFDEIEGDLANVFSADGMQFAADWVRRSSSSDPTYGVVGAYSFWFEDTGSNVITLKVNPLSGESHIVIAEFRRTSQTDLSFDMADLSLGDGSYTLTVGLDSSGTSDVTIGVSESETDVEFPLYDIDITVTGSGSTYTVDRVSRVDKTLYWDNTVEQVRQDIPFIMTWCWDPLESGDDWRFVLPVDARIHKLVVWTEEALGSSQIDIQDSTGSTSYISWVDPSTSADEIVETTPTTWDGVAFAAGTEFFVNAQVIDNTGGSRMVVTLEWIPTHNLPTV